MQTHLLHGRCSNGGGCVGGGGRLGEGRGGAKLQRSESGCGETLRQEPGFLVSSNLETIWSRARSVGEARRKASHSLCPDQRPSATRTQHYVASMDSIQVRPPGSIAEGPTHVSVPAGEVNQAKLRPSPLAATLLQVSDAHIEQKTRKKRISMDNKIDFLAAINATISLTTSGCPNVATRKQQTVVKHVNLTEVRELMMLINLPRILSLK